MRILMLAPQPFYSERGTPIAVLLAARALCRAGHEVDLLTYHEGSDVQLHNLQLLRIRKPPLVSNIPIGFSWKKVICDLWLGVSAYKRLRARHYDVVHAVEESVFLALAARRWFDFRLVYDMDSRMLDQILAKLPVLTCVRRAMSWFEQQALRHADLVLAVCPALADGARDAHRRSRVRVVPDVAFPAAPAAAAAASVPREPVALRSLFETDGRLLLYVGNLEPYQGVDLLLQSMLALLRHGGCNLAIVGGSGHAHARYGARIVAMGLAQRVRLIAPQPLGLLPALLDQADVLCSPRLQGVNTPMKIYSYLAAGRAILATDIPSHRQVLDERCACLAAPEPKAFVAGLLRLLQDDGLRERLGCRGRELAAARYSFSAFERRMASAYRTLTRPRTQGRSGGGHAHPRGVAALRAFEARLQADASCRPRRRP